MKTALIAFLGLPGALIVGVFAFLILIVPPPCGGTGISVDLAALPPAIGQYSGDQLENAGAIINAGSALGVSEQAQTIAVMTAIGESGLYNLDHGDQAGADSRGLFQQRDNGAWGTLADRMNPTIAARNFYRALLAIDGWESMSPSLAANKVQGNADPYHYAGYVDDAQSIMAGLGSEQPGCQAGPAGEVNSYGWAKPAAGHISSGYGPRPIVCVNGLCGSGFHRGIDIAAPDNTPIYAAHGGTVVAAGPDGTCGNWILIDHGGGISTAYCHMYADDLFVHVGDTVTAGQNIARVGCAGACSGPHLHFEVRRNGTRIDPQPFMEQVGISWD